MEKWKDIIGYEDLYQISDLGRIFSKKTSIICKTYTNKKRDNYVYITLRRNKKCTAYRLSVLVSKHFIPNPDNKPQVNHKDCNKQNNAVSNLEWVTPKENMQHCIKNGFFPSRKGELSGGHKLSKSDVYKIRKFYNDFDSGSNKKCSCFKILADIYKVDRSTISRLCRRKTWNDI